MEHSEIERSGYGTLKTLFAKNISIGNYSLSLNIDRAPNSRAKRYVFTFSKLVKKLNGNPDVQGVSSRGIFIIPYLRNIRLGFFNRQQVIEKLD
ncbi:hypothetical protein [Pedobacter miscanthi]|uniref:Uncharacterized protein n=1 Tax=Pedobacter miscanthi TaxID=2259170 RepID=A0A366KZM1_9SPHI|nr:hypothetical protein [Pedobacter miscanthi]RBQ07056.1 hypothetical protein DRW42_12600 [Pedobacter miscanthi]